MQLMLENNKLKASITEFIPKDISEYWWQYNSIG